MTSRNSFFKLMKEDLRQRLWTIVLAAVVFLLPMPIYLAMVISNASSARALASDFIGMFNVQNLWIVLVTCVGAAICAASGFGYLFSKKKTDFFHSLPVKREKLFAVRYVNGVLIYLVPYVAMILICLFIILVTGSFSVFAEADRGTVGEFILILLKGFAVNFAGFLTVYTALILCVTFVGNFVVFNAMAAWLFGIVAVAILLFISFEDVFFNTYSSYISSSYGNHFATIWHRFRFLSPGYFYVRLVGEGRWFEDWGMILLQQLGFTAVLTAFTLWVYKVRPSDGAGKAIAFPILKPIIRGSVELIAGAGLGLCFFAMTDEDYVGWLVFGTILGVVLSHMFIQSVFYYDIRKCFAEKASLGAFAALAVGFVLIMRYDVFGYDTYLPKQNKIESVAIEARLDGYRQIFEFGETEINLVDEIEDMELTNISSVYPYLESLVNDSETYFGIYDEQKYVSSLDGYQTIDVAMRLKNGKTVYRRYKCHGMREEQFAAIFESEEFKRSHYADIYTAPIEGLQMIIARQAMNELGMTLSQAEKEEFLSILRREVSALTLREKLHTTPVAILDMDIAYRETEKGVVYDYEEDRYGYNCELPIYASYTETLRFLKERGFDPEEEYVWTGEEKMYLEFPESLKKYNDMYGADVTDDPLMSDLVYSVTMPNGVDVGVTEDYYINLGGEITEVKATAKELSSMQIPIEPEDMPRILELCTWDHLYNYDILGYSSADYYHVRLQVPVDGYNNYKNYHYRIGGDADLSFLFD